MRSKAAHSTASTTITTADATDESTGASLADAIKSALESHAATTGRHANAVALNPITGWGSFSLGAKISYLAGEMNSHVQNDDAHFTPDRANVVFERPASGSVADACSVLNILKARLNAHFASAVSA